jgi:hypothetical protein
MRIVPLSQLRRQLRRAGKIRLGCKVSGISKKSGNAYTAPKKLTEFRLTSADQKLLLQAARLYGGEVRPWADEPGQFELFTESKEIFVRVLNTEITSEYEFWKAGGCVRRCDGENCRQMVARGNDTVEQLIPCPCTSGAITNEKDQCKLRTRVDIELAGCAALGVFTLETNSVFAASELPAVHEYLIGTFGYRYLAILAIEERETKEEGQETKKFIVPVLRVRDNLAQELLERGGVEIQQLRGVSAQALAPRQVIDAGALPEGVNSLPPASEPEDVGDEEDERITDESTGEVLGTVTETARSASLNGSSTATGEHIAAMSAAAVPIDGQVVENPPGESKSDGLTPDALAYLEFCKISVSLDSDHLDEMYDLCADRGYTLSEVLLMAKTMGYKTKTMIKDYMRGLPKKEQTEA